ncbi:MAG TPA: aminotransferase class I/II-fold pyridoxal phosphate-dependent enzyme, partial [Polyangiales bacterium]|nr:aminotransferase class I/II-fold pyridoxal phosphate-dependent enzyme [Polyangiales bacterium]
MSRKAPESPQPTAAPANPQPSRDARTDLAAAPPNVQPSREARTDASASRDMEGAMPAEDDASAASAHLDPAAASALLDPSPLTAAPIPLVDLAAQHAPLQADLRRAFERVLANQSFILGPEVSAFEAEIAELTGVPHALGVSSGTDALLLALLALGIGPGDEVLVPAFSFFATAGCVARVGARPVFVDIDPRTYNIDVELAAARVTRATKAIIPVHLYGQVCDLEALSKLELPIIEDAAQALGAGTAPWQAGAVGAF